MVAFKPFIHTFPSTAETIPAYRLLAALQRRPTPLFTGVRGRGILGSPDAAACMLARTVEEALTRAGVEAHTLALDITETVLIGASEHNAQALEALKKMGIRLSLDDFGTGYSSLSYLKRLPVDRVKVDRSFVKGLGGNATDTAVVRMIIELCHTLGVEVLAEGVETSEQAALLKDMGCDVGQGYYFARPLRSEELAEQLPEPFLQ
jgi:EAL domain-containing protein (putative c-di-GMP-specific phosphodiesterase class I)